MEKLFKSLIIVSILFFLSTQTALAQSYQNTAGEKVATGIANMVTGFIELPKNIILDSEKEGIPYGLTVGVISGVMHTVGRTVVGAFDVITFMIPTGPSVYPHYVWENFSRETTYGN
ncbi:MAG: exosortase system-associated protein, TIGR04073 family [Nitrosomonas sp.]|nr:exosortase system-associated protein, TIGR04073 family [Nitrosomonas sp.]MDP1949743.1 exosortase system-associated protein, TIGR04073 family [Nitrosomonas sp.]